MQLKGQIAIVTGGGSGIGEATAKLFCQEGAKVIIADVDEDSAMQVANAIKDGGGTALAYCVDVSDVKGVKEMIDQIISRWGRLDILVNNAGIGIAAKLAETTLEDWERVMRVNVNSTFLCCKYAIPHMLQQGGGVIVNVASVAGIVGIANRAVYVASKFAIVGLTKSIAADYAEYNIRCNVVCPGTVESPWISKILASDPDQETTRKKLEARQLIKRMGTPEEIAYAILYLASPQASYVHGSAMIIDGGWTAV